MSLFYQIPLLGKHKDCYTSFHIISLMDLDNINLSTIPIHFIDNVEAQKHYRLSHITVRLKCWE